MTKMRYVIIEFWALLYCYLPFADTCSLFPFWCKKTAYAFMTCVENSFNYIS